MRRGRRHVTLLGLVAILPQHSLAGLAVLACAWGSAGCSFDPLDDEQTPFSSQEETGPMGELARGVLAEVNRVRLDPNAYATRLSGYRENYDGARLTLDGEPLPFSTTEGIAALEEAIQAARQAPAAPELIAAEGLNRAARAHVAYLMESGKFQHEGEGGSSPFERIERYGEFRGSAAENIGSGTDDPVHAVFFLFVDDDVPDRGHRITILNPAYRRAGVGCATHPLFRFACVMNFAAEYGDR